jgi:hypothetical protein
MRRALVGSDRLGSGCLVLRADTRENPGGKNGVMTLVHLAKTPLVVCHKDLEISRHNI